MNTPPYNEEAERAVLGSLIMDTGGKSMDKAKDRFLRSEWFYDRRNQLIFEAIERMDQKNIPVDAINLAESLSQSKELEKAGGYDYLIVLQDELLVFGHIQHHIEIIYRCWQRRALIQHAQSAIEKAYDLGSEISEAVECINEIKLEPNATRSKAEIIREAKELSKKMNTGEIVGLPTPFYEFNRDTFGIPRGIVCPLAGRSGKGKSMLKAHMSMHFITHGIPVLDMCFEDNDVRSTMRLCASLGEYDLFALNRSSAPPSFMERHFSALDRIELLPYYPDQNACTVEDAVIRISKFVRENEADIKRLGGVVWIDGIKDMIPSKGENKTAQEEHISQTLARCAVKHRDISIIPITHLTKLDEKTWITLNNIRGSANQVSNARAAMILQDAGFPPDYKIFDDGKTVVLQMAKTNNGQEGHIALRKNFERGRYEKLNEFED